MIPLGAPCHRARRERPVGAACAGWTIARLNEKAGSCPLVFSIAVLTTLRASSLAGCSILHTPQQKERQCRAKETVLVDRDLLDIFKPPWRILRHKSGNYHVVDAAGRELCWIYVKEKQVTDHKLLDDEEAQALAQAIARLSRKGTSH